MSTNRTARTRAHCRLARFLQLLLALVPAIELHGAEAGAAGASGTAPSGEPAEAALDALLLKDYRPRSIFKIKVTTVDKARYPAIDVHTHDRNADEATITAWEGMMDEVGIAKSVMLASCAGAKFDSIVARYRAHAAHFVLWCDFDYSHLGRPDFAQTAIAELERCHAAGARGIGELMDKGRGLGSSPTTFGIHIDNPLMDPLLERCAELRMPVSIHVAEDAWMYEPMDKTNDGLMNASIWRVKADPGVLLHDEMVDTLEHALQRHPRTHFIAVHLANCCSDLQRLAGLLDRFPNLQADIAARFMELGSTPRAVSQFLGKYQDRILFGTDYANHVNLVSIYTLFRLLETTDEHFYDPGQMQYHWPLYAWGLSDGALRKIYRDNAQKILTASE